MVVTVVCWGQDMRAFALKTAVAAFNKPDNNAEKDIAAQIKKEFDKEYTVLCDMPLSPTPATQSPVQH